MQVLGETRAQGSSLAVRLELARQAAAWFPSALQLPWAAQAAVELAAAAARDAPAVMALKTAGQLGRAQALLLQLRQALGQARRRRRCGGGHTRRTQHPAQAPARLASPVVAAPLPAAPILAQVRGMAGQAGQVGASRRRAPFMAAAGQGSAPAAALQSTRAAAAEMAGRPLRLPLPWLRARACHSPWPLALAAALAVELELELAAKLPAPAPAAQAQEAQSQALAVRLARSRRPCCST